MLRAAQKFQLNRVGSVSVTIPLSDVQISKNWHCFTTDNLSSHPPQHHRAGLSAEDEIDTTVQHWNLLLCLCNV